MSLRLIEIIVPGQELSGLRAELAPDGEGSDLWVDDRGEGRARVLLPAERTESAIERLEQLYGGRDGFRLLLLPVTATVPRSESESAESAGGQRERERLSRQELYQGVSASIRLTWVYGVTAALSTVVAAIGLVRGHVAVIIGAMVIAPLLGPNVALALAATLGDVDLAGRAARTIGVGIAVVAGVSLAVGMVLPVDPSVVELASRTHVGLSDVVLALAAGSAGALAFTTGLPAALIGVMVAVALLPPTVAAGLLLGAGRTDMAAGALLLVATNVVCLNLAAIVTFVVQGIHPRSWWEERKAKRATAWALAFWLVILVAVVALIRVEFVRPD